MGGAFYIRNSIIFQELQPVQTSLEHSIIRVGNTVYIGAYNKPTNKINNIDLHRLMLSGNRVVLMGDLNCKHPEWDANCNKPNKTGKLLREFAENNDLIIHYTETPT